MTLIIGDTTYRIDLSFSLTVTLMFLFCHSDTVILSLLSSLLHEAGHLIIMYLTGQKILKVTFGAFGIRIDRYITSSVSYKKEAFIALGGVLVNLILALSGFIHYCITDSDFFLRLTAVNVIIAIFNMIPIDTLDMGRVLRYTLLSSIDEDICDRILSVISAVSVNLLAVICFAVNVYIGFNLSLIIVTVYLYVITLFKKWS